MLSVTEGKLWDKADVDVSAGIGGLHCDESCISTHQSYKSNPIVDSNAFDICRAYGSYAFSDCSFKAKGFVDDGNIIVNGLGNAHNRHLQFTFSHLFRQYCNASVGSVSSDNVQLVDALLSECFYDTISVETATRAAENGSSLVLQFTHVLLV